MENSGPDLFALLRKAIEEFNAAGGRARDLQNETGVPEKTISNFVLGRQKTLGGRYYTALCRSKSINLDPATGNKLPDRQYTGSRHLVTVRRVPRPESQTSMFFTDVAIPIIPDQFEISEDEAKIIFERRSDDPRAFFAIALAELEQGHNMLPPDAVVERAEARAVIRQLQGIIQDQRERQGQGRR